MMGENEAIPKHWISIYPTYINSKKTLQEGRRISKSKGVENPTTQEILDVLRSTGLNVRAERKMYPRDGIRDWTYNGRVRVEIKDAEGVVLNDKFPTRASVLGQAVEMIPKLKSRLQKSGSASDAAAAPSSKPQKKNKKNR